MMIQVNHEATSKPLSSKMFIKLKGGKTTCLSGQELVKLT